MNKETDMTMKLNPYFESTIETSNVVWSHDENSYQFNFDFTEYLCDKPFDLTDGKPRILLEFLNDKNAEVQIYPLVVDSEKLGVAHFIIPDKILGYVGDVKASLTIDFTNKTYDLGNFYFRMKKSPIDNKMPQLQFYVDEFEKAQDIFKNGLDEFNDDIKESNAKVDEIKDLIIQNDVLKKAEAGSFEDFREQDDTIISKMKNEFSERSINISWFGVDMTGKTDSTKQMNEMVEYVNSITDYVPVVLFSKGEVQFSDTLHFKREVFLKSDGNCWINYTGENEAILFGPDNLTYETYTDFRHFNVDGLKFRKSENAKHAIRINVFVTQPIIKNCDFRDFGKHLSEAIFIEKEVWFALIVNCRFDNGRNGLARQFLHSVPFGNNQIFVVDCLVHSLSGLGTGVVINGVASKIINSKIEGFATDVRVGSQGDYSSIENCYFEKAGSTNTGAIELGEKDTSISTKAPRGVRVIGNYANIHLLADKPVSRFIKIANDEAVVRDLIVEKNSVNDWNEAGVPGIIIQLNNVAGNKDNYANSNVILGTSKISNNLTNSESIMGTDSNRNIRKPKMQADILDRVIAPSGVARFDVLSESGKTQAAFVSMADKSAAMYINDILTLRFFNNGNISFGKNTGEEKYDFDGTVRAKTMKMSEKKEKGSAGEIFEGQDGNLYYVNLQGQTKKITS